MDPITAMLVAGLLTVLFTKTAGSAVTDVAAQAKGKTPPSLEKWRSREQKRRSHGDQPRTEPGPWKRRMQNAADRSNERSAQKHQAKLDRLRDQAPDNITAHKNRLDRRQQRCDQVRAAVGRYASNSWEQTKTAAAGLRDRAAEARAERRAWHENQQRDQTTGGDELGDPTAEPDQPDPAANSNQSDAAVGTVTGQLPVTELATTDPADQTDQPGMQQDQLAAVTPTPHDNTDPQPTDPQPNDPTENGADTVTTANLHSGEITNLTDAAAYVQSVSSYCEQINGTFEQAQAQAAATAHDVQAMLGTLETAQSSLAGQGLNEAASQLSAVSEHLSELVNNMQQAATLLASTEESINTAKATLDDTGHTFQQQQGIAEEMSAHREVANNTAFYQHA